MSSAHRSARPKGYMPDLSDDVKVEVFAIEEGGPFDGATIDTADQILDDVGLRYLIIQALAACEKIKEHE